MIATFSFNTDQWTRLSTGIHNAIQSHCGPVDFSCLCPEDTQWPVRFESKEDETCTCDPVEMLHYITEVTVGEEVVALTWIHTEEEEDETIPDEE